jgi:hypothetical protein
MYRLWHYLLYILLTVGAYFLARHFFPGTVEEAPEAAPDSGDKEVDSLILQGREQLARMKALSFRDPEVTEKKEELCALTGKILKALEQDTSRLPRTKKFLSYYLPTTAGLLERYKSLENNPVGENVTGTLKKIKEMLSKVEIAFRKQLDNLYEADAMDISADIQVMQQMMAAEGLLEKDGL